MSDIARDRSVCLSILKEYTKSESLLKHAYAVETCVRAYASKLNEDVEYWGCVALLHDFDYEMYPTAEEHPLKDLKSLKRRDLMMSSVMLFFHMLIIQVFQEIILCGKYYLHATNLLGLLLPLLM